MNIEHIALWTADLERLRSFYETYFGARANERYRSTRTGMESYFLSFSNGARLELMSIEGLSARPEGRLTGWAHLAVSSESRAAVDDLTARLAAAGYAVLSAPRLTGDGYYESCIADPDGNEIEITA